MKDELMDRHIISLIESAPLQSLSESELNAIRAHTADCPDCLRAFEAAQISSLLLRERGVETLEPSPFFSTRMLATLRERQANGFSSPAWTLGRLWRSAGALASSMVATVAALAVLTFMIPGNELVPVNQVSSLSHSYSAEEVILDQSPQLDEQLTDDQLLTTIFGEEGEGR